LALNLKRGETIDLKLSVINRGTTSDTFQISGQMPAIASDRHSGINSFSFITQVLDEAGDVTARVLHPKGLAKHSTSTLAPGGVQDLLLRTSVPLDLRRAKLGNANQIRLKLTVESQLSSDAQKPRDSIELVIRVSDPL
jgi:hypothetical protein